MPTRSAGALRLLHCRLSPLLSTRLVCLCVALALAATAPPARAQEPTPDSAGDTAGDADDEDDEDDTLVNPLKIHWDRGLHVSGKWDYLHMRVGGDLMSDTAGFLNQESAEETLDTAITGGVEWRRARVYAEGRVSRHVEFKFRYDFTAGNPPSLKDAYGSFVNMPIPSLELTAGRFKAPLGLDGYTGADDLVFMERSLMSWAFLPSRNTGVMAHGDIADHRIRFSVAALQPESDSIDLSDTDNLGYSGRFAYAFRRGQKKENLFHLGVDFWRRNVSDTIQYATSPESNIAPFFVDTGDIPADKSDIWVVESGFQRGKWTIQAEGAITKVSKEDSVDTLTFWGLYAQASYFLTGEKMAYRTDRGTFTRPHPKHPVTEGGAGAMELGFRYSRIDLDDGPIDGGVLADWTVGFNWYPTYNLKLMFNTIIANLQNANPVWIFQMRLQVAF